MKRIFKRLFYGVIFALPLMVVTFALAHADSRPEADPPSVFNCVACHDGFQREWEHGAHGKAASNPNFLKAWEAQEKPGECMACHTTGYDEETETWKADGVTCEACHGTPNPNHPTEPMAADRSAKLCGDCHTETYFEWQVSAHRASGLDCTGCHDPHGTSIKAKEQASDLCATCHRGRASNFAHSEHSKQGLTCKDCHLAQLDGEGEGHARLDHSFNVRLSTCNSCHAYQMHDPVDVHPENPTPMPPDSLSSAETVSVDYEPKPVNAFGFTTLSGLIGLAAGIILGPWLERLNRRK